MDTRTGKRITQEELMALPESERKHYVRIKRDFTKLVQATNQMKLYLPCWCGSGKKLKFCCKNK